MVFVTTFGSSSIVPIELSAIPDSSTTTLSRSDTNTDERARKKPVYQDEYDIDSEDERQSTSSRAAADSKLKLTQQRKEAKSTRKSNEGSPPPKGELFNSDDISQSNYERKQPPPIM